MTATFAPCPTYAGYEASPCGVIRRAARPSTAKNGPAVGTIVPAKVMTPIAARRNYVGLSKPHGWTRIADMVADAWPDLPEDDDTYDALKPDLNRRPRPVPGGRVLMLAEWIAELRTHA